MDASESLFRPPSKRRRVLRRREDDNHPVAPRSRSRSRSQSPRDAQQDDAANPPNFLRQRRLHRARKGGIEFSATARQTTDTADQSAQSTATTEELEAERIQTMCDRFTAHTGQTVDVDRHMYGAAF